MKHSKQMTLNEELMETDEELMEVEDIGPDDEDEQRKIVKKAKMYPRNVAPIPRNIKHLVKYGSLQYLVPADGNCGFNSGSTHIFRDPKYGKQFRMIINNHMADRWLDYWSKWRFCQVCSWSS